MSSSFTCASTRTRSLKKVVKALPRSPNKRNEIVKSLASKFDLRIKLDHKKLGRPENALSDEEQTWLSKFLDRPDITYINPGKNNQPYAGKENGKSVFVPIKHLLWNIRDLLNIANGCSLANEIDTALSSLKVFDKQVTFRQLYAFLKSGEELVFKRDIPQSSCLCEICENILLLSKGIASSAKIALANNVQSLIEDFRVAPNNRVYALHAC